MIVSLGESLIDFIDDVAYPGGCPLNVAISIARLKGDVAFIGKISKDEYGRKILDTLVDNLIFFEPQMCMAQEPSAYTKALVNKDGTNGYEFHYKNSAAFSMSQKEIESAFELISDLEYLFVGSVALCVESTGVEIEKVLKNLDPKTVVFLDVNVRESIIEDKESYLKRLDYVYQRANIVRLSLDDMNILFPGQSEEEVAAIMKEHKVEHFILTKGQEGAVWYTLDSAVIKTKASTVDVVDTVGCGDSFDGALLYCLQKADYYSKGQKAFEEYPIDKISRFCSLIASENCKKSGCNPPFIDSIEQLLIENDCSII